MLSSELARGVLDSAPDAMIVIDQSGRVLFVNQQVASLFGYSHEEVVGQPIELLIPQRFHARHVSHRHRYVEATRFRPMGKGLDLFARRKDGTEFPVEISLSPIRDDDTLLVAAAIRDVTDRTRVDQELREAHAAADRATQAKSRFLATASHDLRQPLQSLGLLNGALHRLLTNADALEALAQQDLAIAAMSRLLNALLDISKLESGAIRAEITDFKIASLLEELRNEFAGLASSKGLDFQVQTSGDCACSDPSLVGQALRNLISNAIKYTHKGFVHVRSRRENNRVRVEVVDSGVGIAADHLEHIYEEFYQIGVGANASRDGYGLGLSIVQRVARLLDLGIDVVSELGRGSSFALVLPASTASTAPAVQLKPEPSATAEPTLQRHILLVEDDPSVRNATRMFLKVAGYRVTTAGSLTEAEERANETGDFDLVVSDYHLADGETGLQVIAWLRQLLGVHLKAILVTGDTSSAIRDLQRDENLRLASKPIDSDELVGLINTLLPAK